MNKLEFTNYQQNGENRDPAKFWDFLFDKVLEKREESQKMLNYLQNLVEKDYFVGEVYCPYFDYYALPKGGELTQCSLSI